MFQNKVVENTHFVFSNLFIPKIVPFMR